MAVQWATACAMRVPSPARTPRARTPLPCLRAARRRASSSVPSHGAARSASTLPAPPPAPAGRDRSGLSPEGLLHARVITARFPPHPTDRRIVAHGRRARAPRGCPRAGCRARAGRDDRHRHRDERCGHPARPRQRQHPGARHWRADQHAGAVHVRRPGPARARPHCRHRRAPRRLPADDRAGGAHRGRDGHAQLHARQQPAPAQRHRRHGLRHDEHARAPRRCRQLRRERSDRAVGRGERGERARRKGTGGSRWRHSRATRARGPGSSSAA